MENVFVVLGLKELNDQYECEFDKKVLFVATSEERAKNYMRSDINSKSYEIQNDFIYKGCRVYAFKRYQIIEMRLNDKHLRPNAISQYAVLKTHTEIIIEED